MARVPTAQPLNQLAPGGFRCPGAGYDGSIWPHHDGFKWLHSVDNLTVRSGPVKSGSEKEEQIKGGPDQGDTGVRQTVAGPIQAVQVGPALAVIATPAQRPRGKHKHFSCCRA